MYGQPCGSHFPLCQLTPSWRSCRTARTSRTGIRKRTVHRMAASSGTILAAVKGSIRRRRVHLPSSYDSATSPHPAKPGPQPGTRGSTFIHRSPWSYNRLPPAWAPWQSCQRTTSAARASATPAPRRRLRPRARSHGLRTRARPLGSLRGSGGSPRRWCQQWRW